MIFDFSYVSENYHPGMTDHPTPKIPRGLCGNPEDHEPHMHESASLGWFFCHADQEKRRACDHRQCPADACQGC